MAQPSKFEYKIVTFNNLNTMIVDLNTVYGVDGWRVMSFKDHGGIKVTVVLERETTHP